MHLAKVDAKEFPIATTQLSHGSERSQWMERNDDDFVSTRMSREVADDENSLSIDGRM